MFLVMILVILAATLWLSVEQATAAGTITYSGARFVWGKGVVFVFDASGYKNADVKGARITVGSKSFNVYCTVNKKAEKIICVAGSRLTRHAGEMGILSLAGQGFYVTIPYKPAVLYGNTPLACPAGTGPGADVTFLTGGGDTYTEFIFGSTLAQVHSSAEGWVDGSDIVGIDSIGGLYCHK
ncbi:MAG: hypothetical protein JW730_09935 [Anaerolineales bacterium]|nr:hypothetical protein [Anaerolineales bacterium]